MDAETKSLLAELQAEIKLETGTKVTHRCCWLARSNRVGSSSIRSVQSDGPHSDYCRLFPDRACGVAAYR